MRTRDDYDRAFAIVAEVIRDWDPDGLLAGGAPKDEYDLEVAKIMTSIPKIRSKADATLAISAVFSEMFNPGDFTPVKCETAASEMYSRLVKAGVISNVHD